MTDLTLYLQLAVISFGAGVWGYVVVTRIIWPSIKRRFRK
jgi:hypothetical protein